LIFKSVYKSNDKFGQFAAVSELQTVGVLLLKAFAKFFSFCNNLANPDISRNLRPAI